MVSRGALSGVKMLRFSAALLLVGGPIVGVLFGSLETRPRSLATLETTELPSRVEQV